MFKIGNAEGACIDKDSGVFVKHEGQYTFMGFVNTYYSYRGICTGPAFFLLYKLNQETLRWIKASLALDILNNEMFYTLIYGEVAA